MSDGRDPGPFVVRRVPCAAGLPQVRAGELRPEVRDEGGWCWGRNGGGARWWGGVSAWWDQEGVWGGKAEPGGWCTEQEKLGSDDRLGIGWVAVEMG